MSKIFIVEDDKGLRDGIKKLLVSYGYTCEDTDDFSCVVEKIMDAKPDLILLDINLPYYDGFFICRALREKSQVPIIVVTSRSSEMDELMSMNLGADDYITKPYNTQILLARIGAVLKRTNQSVTSLEYSHKGVCLNVGSGIVTFQGEEVELTKNEQRILILMMRHKGIIVSRDEIMNELWQSDEFVDDNTLTVNINRLRKKLEEIGVKDFLITKRGQGYII